MSKPTRLLGLLLLCVLPSFAQTRTQVHSTTTNSSTSETLTITSTSGGEDAVVFILNAGASGLSVTDSASETYTCPHNTSFLGAAYVTYCYICNMTSGVTTINVTGGANNNFYTTFIAYSGGATSSCADGQTAFTNTGSGGAWTSSNVTTSTANEVLVGVAASQSGGVTVGAGWTNASGAVGYGSYFTTIGEKFVTSTGTYAFTGTQPGSNTTAALVTIKAAGGAVNHTMPAVVF